MANVQKPKPRLSNALSRGFVVTYGNPSSSNSVQNAYSG